MQRHSPMENPDQRAGAVSNLVRILRILTRTVQIAPFAFLLLFAVYLIVSPFLPEWLLRLSDAVFNVPVYATAGLLGAGRILKLCPWFRTACLLPFTTKVESYIDSFVFTFTQNEIIIINVATGAVIISYIYLAYRHFFHGREATS